VPRNDRKPRSKSIRMAALHGALDNDQGDRPAANYQLDNSIITVQMS
jgi:hypothetical protein